MKTRLATGHALHPTGEATPPQRRPMGLELDDASDELLFGDRGIRPDPRVALESVPAGVLDSASPHHYISIIFSLVTSIVSSFGKPHCS